MTRALAVAMAPKVRVNAVAPALYSPDTPSISRHFGAKFAQVIADASRIYPLRRIAHPNDITDAILGLAAGVDFVTGQTLIADGGVSLS